MSFSLLLYAIVLLVIYILFKWYNDRLPKLPGPWGVPIFGYIPFMGRKLNVTLDHLGNKYGPVYQIAIGSQRMVIIHGNKAIKECVGGFKGSEIADRPKFDSYKGFGIFGAPGYDKTFKVYKNLTLKSMALFGNHRREELQEAGYRAVDMLIREIKLQNNQAFDPKPTMYSCIWTIMGYICYGKYFDKDDEEVKQILSNADSFGRIAMLGVLIDFLPWAKYFMKNKLAENEILSKQIMSQSTKLAAMNVTSWDGISTRNLTDMFRVAARDMEEAGEKKDVQVTDEKLQKMLNNLFGAGFATVAVTLKWAILLLTKYAEIQEQVHEEIDSVLGQNRPTFEDQTQLPFCSAVVAEVYRYSSMAALAMTHAAVKDTLIEGYPVPKGTPIIVNLYSAHYDETVFAEAHSFNPGRFLNKDRTLNKALVEQVIPYGVGVRRCGGELLARLEIFLFFVCIFQECHTENKPGQVLDPTKYRFGLGLDPEPFEVIFRSRFSKW